MNCTVFLYDEVEIDHFLVTNVIIMNQSFLTVADPRDPASDRLILSKVCLCNCCFFFCGLWLYLHVNANWSEWNKEDSICL